MGTISDRIVVAQPKQHVPGHFSISFARGGKAGDAEHKWHFWPTKTTLSFLYANVCVELYP